MQNYIWLLLAIAGGVGMALQGGINTQLTTLWGKNPILIGFISFCVGTLGLLILLIINKTPFPELNGKTSWWHWAGGLLGAYLVTMVAYLAPRLGGSILFGAILVGQMFMVLILEHYGLIGYPEKLLSWQRVAGVLMLIAGMQLIRNY